MIKAKRAGAILCCLAVFLANSAFAAGPATPAGDDPSPDSLAELQRLRTQLDEQQNQLEQQQKQIETLKTALEAQKKILEKFTATMVAGDAPTAAPVQNRNLIASSVPMLPPTAPSKPSSNPFPLAPPQQPVAADNGGSSPLQLKIGDTTI